MVNNLLERSKEDVEDYYSKEYGTQYDSDILQQAEDVFDHMKEEDIVKLVEESELAEKEQLFDLEAENAKATSEGFSDLTHKINSIRKANGLTDTRRNIQDFTPEEIAKAVSKKSKLAESKAKLDASRTALLQSGGLNALPEFVEYVKDYIKYFSNKVEDFIDYWKKDFPKTEYSDKELSDAFNEVKGEGEKAAEIEKGITKKHLESRRLELGLSDTNKLFKGSNFSIMI